MKGREVLYKPKAVPKILEYTELYRMRRTYYKKQRI